MAERLESIDPRVVAERWLNGESVPSIAADFDISLQTVYNRLREARAKFPDLPWDKREKKDNPNSNRSFVRMVDGKKGVVVPRRYGSIVKGRGAR